LADVKQWLEGRIPFKNNEQYTSVDLLADLLADLCWWLWSLADPRATRTFPRKRAPPS